MNPYSLKKSKKVLVGVYQLFRKKRKKLLTIQAQEIQHDLRTLQEEILKKNRDGANYMARKCLDYGQGILKKSPLQKFLDLTWSLVFALCVVLLIRQLWFELYEIPTGSMRPTFKEKDRLIVSKTDFGINVPFRAKHLYFDGQLPKRSGTVVFTSANMDVYDPNTRYFWIFPGKKQLVKRLMALSGDVVYFYGGKMYGVDREGRDISDELQMDRLSHIDHIPFIRFDGRVSTLEPFPFLNTEAFRIAIVHQMNEPIARLTLLGNNRLEGEMLYTPRIHTQSKPPVQRYSDLWGIGNFAISQMLTSNEARPFVEQNELDIEEAPFYLKLSHHPDLSRLEMGRDRFGKQRPRFILSESLIPLDRSHLKALFTSLYTDRFVVRNGYAMRYTYKGSSATRLHHHNLPRLEGVPDGTYEYIRGQAYQIKWGGLSKKLSGNHSLMKFSPQLISTLFNYGIGFNKQLLNSPYLGSERFAYFRDGDLYVMGSAIFKKGSPTLENFIRREEGREKGTNSQNLYLPFVDQGAPVKVDGSLDRDKILSLGLKVPDRTYLALGDNYAASADSRDFGFVPEGNLRGGPSWIFWPFGSRFGPPNQPPYRWLTFSNLTIWALAFLCFSGWVLFHRLHYTLPLKDL